MATYPLTDPAYRAFVRHLVALRTAAGVSQRELAGRLSRQQSYVAKSENFERRLDPAEFLAFARALGADPVEAFASVAKALGADPST